MQGPGHRIVAWAVAITLLAGCSGSPAPAGEGGANGSGDGAVANAARGLDDRQRSHLVEEGETTWDVTYAEDTVVVDGEGLDALVDGDDEAGTYTFDTAAAKDAGIALSDGTVLVIAGRALRRVTATQQADGRTTVQSEPASLADAIEEGTVAWDVPVQFDFDQFVTAVEGDGPRALAPDHGEVTAARAGTVQLAGISMRTPEGRIVPVQSGQDVVEGIYDSIDVDPAEGSVAWTYSAQGNTFRFRLTAQGDSVDVLVVVSREGGGGSSMAFRGEGTVASLRSAASSRYAGGELVEADVDMRELGGDLDLSLAVAGAGTSPVELDVPVPMLTYTWLVGPVPVTVDMTAEIIGTVKAEANASAQAKASFSYRGDAGFAYEGTDVSVSGNTDIDEMDPEPADSAAGMGIDVDAQFGIGFPKVALSLFGQGVVPHLRWGSVIGSSLQWGGPAAGFPASSLCKEAYVRMEVSGGYDITVLGRDLASEEFPPFYEDERRTTSDSCPEE